ncbi:MAG TPA: metallophosphoesterase [Tepidisphaeraceae bacterium]|nr:metallophosphoesterase [Tepidisphaeraceae bacterium]
MTTRLSRRTFVAGSLAAAGLPAIATAAAPPPANPNEIAFFFVSDSHALALKDDPAKIDPASALVTGRLIDVLNALPGTAIPAGAGGGTVGAPRGVIHGGDIIDSGDKAGQPFVAMQKTELWYYNAEFGLTGADGRLKYPVYEVHGNHDSPSGAGLAIEEIKRRNKTRPGLVATSSNGLHYAWDWGPVHFVNLGIVVGTSPRTMRKRRYNPLGSLDFLVADLKEKVGDSGRPVIVTHHVDVARYGQLPDNPDGPYDNKEWDPVDVHAFYDALKPYNVIAVLYGHTHARAVFKWDGSSTKAGDAGLDVFNVKDSAHFKGPKHTFFYFHLDLAAGRMTVREYATPDKWVTATWTTQTWTKSIKVGKA